MSRFHNLTVFFDGTWNESSDTTNVWLLRDDIRLGEYMFSGECDTYVTDALYESGPGTSANWTVFGGAFAADLGKALVDAYAWICEKVLNIRHDEPDSLIQVYVFGFSRGAYRAHSFSWLLNDCGIAENFAKCREIALAFVEHDLLKAQKLSCDGKIASPPIKMLGLWDVVTAPLDCYGNYHDSEVAPIVDRVYHAMAANERRINFSVMKYDASLPAVRQCWFSGVHSDVGGGYPSDERELSNVALQWMKKLAMINGLDFLNPPDGSDQVDFNNLKKVHNESSSVIDKLTNFNRAFCAGEKLHISLFDRQKLDDKYRMFVQNAPTVYSDTLVENTAYRSRFYGMDDRIMIA